ncbi:MAG: hypothetical protein ACYTFG_21480, partial [Planctomycetota bacterium]
MLRKRVLAQDGCTVPDWMWLAGLLEAEGLDEEARQAYDTLQKFHGACPIVRWAVAEFEQTDSSFLTSEECRARAQAGYSEAVASGPAFYPGWLALGDLLSTKDKLKALEHYTKALELRPDACGVRGKLIRVYRDLGWKAEAWGQVKALAESHSDLPWTHFTVARWYGDQGNEFFRLKHLERAVEEMQSAGRGWFFQSWEKLGMFEKLEAYYRDRAQKRPSDAGIRGHLARTLICMGRLEEARSLLEEAHRIDPENRWVYSMMTDLEGHSGDMEKLKSIWKETLSAPAERGLYDHRIREALDFNPDIRVGGRVGRPVDVEAIIKEAPPATTFKKVSSVVLFERREIRFFGPDLAATEESRRRVVMILNKKGGERYGRIFLPDRIREARVFTLDGKILEPDPVQEGRFIALPALDKGQIIDVDELRFGRVGDPTEGYRGLLNVTDIRRPDEPVLEFQLIVSFPEGTGVEVRRRNLDSEPEITVEEGRITYRWVLKDLVEFKREMFMPGAMKVLPCISFYQGKPDSRFIERELRSQHMDEKVSEFVRKKVRELCEGLSTDRDKLRVLYDFCVTEIKDGWNNPTQTLRKKEGSVEDLFLALARGAGLDPKRAYFRRFPNFHAEWDMSPLSFEGSLVYVPLEGRGEVLFPRRFVPFGVFPGEACGCEALLVSRRSARWITLPMLPS